ncbi:MAG: gas vesicle protein [Streptosporangiales bacterium]|nr:gas vesicle protein [Streptosporangiales bacterium]
MSAEAQTLWVYGVVPVPVDASLDDLERHDDLPDVRLVESGELAAIVGDAPDDDAKATRNQALAHARVLETAVRDAPVVPFRFGMMASGGEQQVSSELLDARHDELAQLLERVEDRLQMTLKVYYHEDAVLREIVANEPEIARLREAAQQGSEEATKDVRIRLGEIVNTAVEQRRERDSAELLEHLKPVSLAGVVEPLELEFMVLNAPFLVERDRLSEFEAAVEEAAEERRERMRFRLLGPMPAYNFIDVERPAWV